MSKKDIAYFKSLKEDEIVKCHHNSGQVDRNNLELGEDLSLNLFPLNLISVVIITLF